MPLLFHRLHKECLLFWLSVFEKLPPSALTCSSLNVVGGLAQLGSFLGIKKKNFIPVLFVSLLWEVNFTETQNHCVFISYFCFIFKLLIFWQPCLSRPTSSELLTYFPVCVMIVKLLLYKFVHLGSCVCSRGKVKASVKWMFYHRWFKCLHFPPGDCVSCVDLSAWFLLKLFVLKQVVKDCESRIQHW